MTLSRIGVATTLAPLLMSSPAFAAEKIKVGVTATLEGTYTVLGIDGLGGFNAAVKKYGNKVGNKELEFVVASTDATPDSAVRAVRKLIEQDKVDILISPLAGDDLCRPRAQLLPLQHGWCAVAGRPRQVRL